MEVKKYLQQNKEVVDKILEVITPELEQTLLDLVKIPYDKDWNLKQAETRGKYLAYEKVIKFLKGKL